MKLAAIAALLRATSAFLCGSAVFLVVPSTLQASEVRFSNVGFIDRPERE